MMPKSSAICLCLALPCVLAALFGPPRFTLSFPVAFALLMLAYAAQRLGSSLARQDINSMRKTRETFGTIKLRSRRLVISDQYDLSGGLTIDDVPEDLAVDFRYREDANCKVVTMISLHSDLPCETRGQDSVSVDSGWLYFGDPEVTHFGELTESLSSVIEAALDEVTESNPMRLKVMDSVDRPRGVVCETGIGDGLYTVTWGNRDSGWALKVRFV